MLKNFFKKGKKKFTSIMFMKRTNVGSFICTSSCWQIVSITALWRELVKALQFKFYRRRKSVGCCCGRKRIFSRQKLISQTTYGLFSVINQQHIYIRRSSSNNNYMILQENSWLSVTLVIIATITTRGSIMKCLMTRVVKPGIWMVVFIQLAKFIHGVVHKLSCQFF